MVPFFYAIFIWFVFLLEWREGRKCKQLGWFFPEYWLQFWRNDIPGEASQRYSCWRGVKGIPVEEKSKCDWHQLLLEQVFPSGPIWYFLRQVTRTDRNAWWNLLYLRLICWREREFALILVLKMWLILRRDCGSHDSTRDCLMITVMDFWIC